MSANLANTSKRAFHCQRPPLGVASTLSLLLAALSLVMDTTRAQAQAPGLLWTTNIGARLFAVDSQTNVYANAGGTVIILNGNGVPLQTNSICPRPGLAVRDPNGDYYFAGLMPSHLVPGGTRPVVVVDPQDFGGVVLSNAPVFLAKYSPMGNLLWATNFGPLRNDLNYVSVDDFVQDWDRNTLVAFRYAYATTFFYAVCQKHSQNGLPEWSADVLPFNPALNATSGRVRLTSVTPTDTYALTYVFGYFTARCWRLDGKGTVSWIANWPTRYDTGELCPRTIVNSQVEMYNVEGRFSDPSQLTKRDSSGAAIWSTFTGYSPQRAVGPDVFDGVHVATDTRQLSRYDSNGNLAWTTYLPSNCEELILDSHGNRFLALAGGLVARLANHRLTATATSGGTVTLNPPGGMYLATNIVIATAQPAPGYHFLDWLGDATGSNHAINVSMERDKAIHAVFGTMLSTTLTGIGSVQVWPPGGLHPVGTTLRLTAIPQPGNHFGFWGNAATGNTNPLHYILTEPNPTVSSSFAPLPADQAALTVLINGHGRVNANPRANAYPTNQSVTLTAVPDSEQDFINWSGDASGTQNPLVVSMAQSRVITANFSSRPLLRVDRPGVEGFTPEGFRLRVVSDPQSTHEIRASTNLTTWMGIGRVTNDFGEVQFTDTNAVSSPARFYRAAP